MPLTFFSNNNKNQLGTELWVHAFQNVSKLFTGEWCFQGGLYFEYLYGFSRTNE